MQSPRLVKEMDNMMKLIIAIVQDEDASHYFNTWSEMTDIR